MRTLCNHTSVYIFLSCVTTFPAWQGWAHSLL
nr:MAG TPA: hypothetical protein [Caudoviricetes sp.]DAW60126.1 MAG TPA: hypothetical protein [Caudoviricetes sp.]